ncbi:MAG: hypothetical protein IT299_00690 [Dehalococcoidia bacterium]|nr:hypothetical protein [Dehalococcoidia bacterium]
MTTDPDELREEGAEVRVCAACGHSEDEHRVVTDEAERGRPELCVTCGDRHAFVARVEPGER